MTLTRHWDEFAAREPYFAVLTHEKYLRANLTDDGVREFFASGEDYVSHVYETLRNRVAPTLVPRTILEVGCGPGRLAIPFARRASMVTAVDVSPSMLEAARANAARYGVSNIELRTPDDLGDDQFDLVNACLIFQYVSPSAGLDLFRSMLQRIAPGGAGAFQFPYRRTTRRLLSITRWTRAHVPGVNRVLNVVRGRAAGFPFIQPSVYDLDAVRRVAQESGYPDPYIIFRHEADLDLATLFVRMGGERKDVIDVKRLIASTPLEQLNRTAEDYFANLTDWEDLLAKPFAKPADAPPILINLATILDGLRLYPGLTVLEFGAGTGWLSRFLTQLGCRVILMDVSTTALRIARELYERLPPIGERPDPRFLPFDGRHIDLPDASVERLVCFDAFHHAPNPDEVLGEFARVLKPGGVAAFAEPGPEHSRTAQSQFEMRTYGVVENDVDVRAIWEAARKVGFADMRLAGFNARPFTMSIDEYDDLLTSGDTLLRWANWSREFMVNVRDFFLYREGEEPLDSRRAEGLGCRIDVAIEATAFAADQPIRVRATVANTGSATWLESTANPGGVSLGSHLYEGSGRIARFEYHWEPLPALVRPGQSVTMSFALPPLEVGAYEVEFDCVARQVTWFAMVGSNSPRLKFQVG